MVFAQWKRSMHRHRHTHALSLIHILTERVQRKIHFLCRMVISPCRNCIMLNVPPDIKAVGCFALLNLTLHSPNTQRRQSKSNEFLFSCWFFSLPSAVNRCWLLPIWTKNGNKILMSRWDDPTRLVLLKFSIEFNELNSSSLKFYRQLKINICTMKSNCTSYHELDRFYVPINERNHCFKSLIRFRISCEIAQRVNWIFLISLFYDCFQSALAYS